MQEELIRLSPVSQRKEPIRLTPEIVENIKELGQKGLKHREIAQLTGLERSTVTKALSAYAIEQQGLEGYKDARAEIFAGLQHRFLVSITNEEIQKMAPRDRVLSAGILYDKERLERGLSTNNIDAHLMLRNDQTLDSKLQELQALVDSL